MVARGEVAWLELEQEGRHPVVVLTRDEALPRLRNVVVALGVIREGRSPILVRPVGLGWLAFALMLAPAADSVPVASAAPVSSADPPTLSRLAQRRDEATVRADLAHARPAARGPLGPSAARVFYVDAVHGNDHDAGTSPGTAWRSLRRANQQAYRGGDRLLLAGGERVRGPLLLSPANVGGTSRRRRFVVASYGAGRAIVSAGRSSGGIEVLDVSGITIRGLTLSGPRSPCGTRGSSGILFVARTGQGPLEDGIEIAHVDAHGFCDGIDIGAADDRSGFSHVRISFVRVHDNADAGIFTHDPARRRHDIRDVVISHVEAVRNEAQGGIVLFGVQRARVDHSVASANGRNHGGAVGIWAFDADRVLFTHNESSGTQTIHADDGDGFDFDGGVTNSRMEDNYAHDNQGVGFLICECVGGYYRQFGNSLVHNVSIDDGASGQTSGIYVGGGSPFHAIRVTRNIVYSRRGTGPLVSLDGEFAPYSDVLLGENTVVSGSAKPLLHVELGGARDVRIRHNAWRNCAGPYRMRLDGRMFGSFRSWQAGGEERAPRFAGPAACSPAFRRAAVRAVAAAR